MKPPVRQDVVGLVLTVASSAAGAVQAVAASSGNDSRLTAPSRILSKMLALRDQVQLLSADAEALSDYMAMGLQDGEGHAFQFGQPILLPYPAVQGFRNLVATVMKHSKDAHLLAVDLWSMSAPVPSAAWLDRSTKDVLDLFNLIFQSAGSGVDNITNRLAHAVNAGKEFVGARAATLSDAISHEQY